jgi:hypothetical protein
MFPEAFMGQRESQSKTSPKQRVVATLDRRLEKRLLSYTVAATAAGVGALVCSPRAEATVVYTSTWIPIASMSQVTLDLNNDGIADFQFSNKRRIAKTSTSCFSSGYSRRACLSMKVLPQNQSNAVWGTNNYASALTSGVSLGSQGKFQAGHQSMAREIVGRTATGGYPFYGSAGPWKETTHRFLGLKFVFQGQVHYGWARLDVTATTNGIYGGITGYAYETEPNTPILTGQESGARKRHKASHGSSRSASPGSLGMLAGGATGSMAKAKDQTRK